LASRLSGPGGSNSTARRSGGTASLSEHYFRQRPAVVGFSEFGVFPESAAVKDGGLPVFARGEILVSGLDVLLFDFLRIPATRKSL